MNYECISDLSNLINNASNDYNMNVTSCKNIFKHYQNKIKAKTLKTKPIVKMTDYDHMPTLGLHSPQFYTETILILFTPC